jgi:hypothetical protein
MFQPTKTPILSAALIAAAALAAFGQNPRSKSGRNGWLKVGGEIRGRIEAPTGLSNKQGADDIYLLTRARLRFEVNAAGWLTGTAEFQDSRAGGYDRPLPGTVVDHTDIRQAWLRVGQKGETGWSARAGRMPLKLGSGRLVWDPDWGNAGTVFDGAQMSFVSGRGRVDAIAGAPVAQGSARPNRRIPGVALYGVIGAARVGGGTTVEPYVFIRRFDAPLAARAELHQAWGGRVYGSAVLPGLSKTTYELELTRQTGTFKGSALRAWGTVATVSVAPFRGRLAPALTAVYTFASGDDSPADKVRGTFQVFYPMAHLRTGATDRLGWSNIRDWLGEARWKLPRKTSLSAGIHLPSLATTADALYSKSGSVLFLNSAAASGRIGTEVFILADKELSSRLTAGIGIAHLYPGPFLRQSGRAAATQPYVFMTYKY